MKTCLIPALITGLFIITACEKENPQIDPCAETIPITADFLIQENVGDSLVVTESVLLYNSVTFQATRSASSYTWKIGEDERTFTEPIVQLHFLDDAVGEIFVQLVVEGSPNTECFPEDDGIDTLVRTFHVIEWNDAPIIGKYEGYFESKPEKKDEIVEVKYTSPEEDPKAGPYGDFELYNINKGCNLVPQEYNASVWVREKRGARAFRFDANYGGTVNYLYNCDAPNAWLNLYSSDTLVIDFTYSSPERDKRLEDRFIGIKKVE